MRLLPFSDPFHIIEGTKPVSIGAPHHGSRPNSGADWGTGPIATALASYLDGRAVVVNDLRRRADVNKDPSRLVKYARHYATRYQNAMFDGRPNLVIEIHGHTSGRYDIEITTGFELNPVVQAEAEYLDRLNTLKKGLSASILNRLGKSPSIGVWPLDRDVTKTATDTFTFQKVRRMRHLAGINCFGLHIEINAALRVGKKSRLGHVVQLAPQLVQALARALGESVQQSFIPLTSTSAIIPLQQEASSDRQIVAQKRYKITHLQEGSLTENLVILHPDALQELSLLEGDSLLVCRDEEELNSRVASSLLVQRNEAGISQRLRNQVGVKPGEWVTLIKLARQPTNGNSQDNGHPGKSAMVMHSIQPGNDYGLWISSHDLSELGMALHKPARVIPRQLLPVVQVQELRLDDSLPIRASALSQRLADRVGITLGETLRLDQD